MERPSRRKLLAGLGAATVSLAGCTDALTSSADGEQLTVETLAVEGSPGGELTVNQPGTAVLVDFFATWCQPCKPQMAELREVHSQYPDLQMVSLSWETDTGAIKSFWQEYEGTWPVAQDTDLVVAEHYDIDGRLPTKIVIDTEGEEVWRTVGLSAADTIAGHVEDALA